MEAICKVLDCQPGDILEYVDEKELSKALKTNFPPHYFWLQFRKVIHLTKMLNSIPLAYLEDIESVISEKMKSYKSQQ